MYVHETNTSKLYAYNCRSVFKTGTTGNEVSSTISTCGTFSSRLFAIRYVLVRPLWWGHRRLLRCCDSQEMTQLSYSQWMNKRISHLRLNYYKLSFSENWVEFFKFNPRFVHTWEYKSLCCNVLCFYFSARDIVTLYSPRRRSDITMGYSGMRSKIQ